MAVQNKKTIQQQIKILRNHINHHDKQYYVLHQPEIADREYDRLMHKLQELEKEHPDLVTPDSPTQRVGGQVLEGFQSVRHHERMLSLDNTYSIDEVRSWYDRVCKGVGHEGVAFVVEPKIDGVSANLTYRDGMLVLGATRGDGQQGEAVTANIKTIHEIPLRLQGNAIPAEIEIRGEVYMKKHDFRHLNKQRSRQQESLFANARNATAGSLKLLDTRVVAQRPLSFFAHSLGVMTGNVFDSHWDFLQQLKSWSMSINPYIFLCKNIDEALVICQEWEEKRDELDYEIDGMVIKVNSLNQQRRLGTTLKSPRWAVAYKFAAHQATTTIEDIITQVGRTGVLTPVASLSAVDCGGVTISRATLHNFDEIERLGIQIGDRVVVERAGDVIPKIISVVESVRNGKERKIALPKRCPVCGAEIVKKREEVAYRCINPSCPVQLEKGLLHFASRAAMDIDGMGESVVQALVQNGYVKDFADIYYLTKKQLLTLPLFKDKKAENLLNGIKESKERPLHRFLFGLGIRHVGEKAAFILAQRFKSLDSLMRIPISDLESMHEIGVVMAESIHDFFHQPKSKKLISKLQECGVNMKEPHSHLQTRALSGKTFVFTGELASLTREEAEAEVRMRGAHAASSVSKKTDFVVIGTNPGSKYKKARTFGVTIIDEQAFKKILKES